MKQIVRISFYMILLLFSFAATAQKKKFSVQFKNGKFISGGKMDLNHFDKRKIEGALFQDKYFVLLQFSFIPSGDIQQQLKAKGIHLNQYISDYAYLATINKNFNPAGISTYNIATIHAVPSFYKIDKSVPAFVNAPDKASQKVYAVNYNSSCDKKLVEQEFKKTGAVIIESKFNSEGILYVEPDTMIVDKLAAMPFVNYISVQAITDKALNYNEVASTGVSGLNAVNGKNLNGRGVTIGVGDNSDISTHVDFSGRLISRTPIYPDNHGTHTAGTAAGGGIKNIRNHGIAPQATVINQYFSDIIVNAPAYYQDYNMVVTNNSYYAGDVGCTGEREYDNLSVYADEQMSQYKNIMHVVASGNDGGLVCSPYPAGFGTVKTGWQCAKNVLTVGAVKQQDYTIAYFSSRGPASDGRIKPEICAGGWNVLSTTPGNNYGYNSGTSMAAPVVTGVLALMNERYKQIHSGASPKSALMKAIACNTAEDLGNPGPDFTYGFGMINARRAINAIDSSRFFLNDVLSGEEKQHLINIPSGVAKVKIMLYWADKAAAINASGALVNDLDLSVTGPSSDTHLPLVLNHSLNNVNDYATEGADHINNIEQVVISDPLAGAYTIRIKGSAVPFGPQEYIITYEIIYPEITVEYPFGGEALVPGEQETIRWNYTGNNMNPFTIEYSLNNGQSWSLIDNNVSSSLRFYNWPVPSGVTDSALIRVSKNSTSFTDKSNFCFSVLGQPVLTGSAKCEGSVQLSWTRVASADMYDVLVLDSDSMKQVISIPDTAYMITGLNKYKTYWFGVRARSGTVTGRRSISVDVQPAGGSCTETVFNNDIRIDSVLTPNTARQFFSNESNAVGAVSVRIRNLGNTSVTTPFTVSYSCEAGTATETVSEKIPAAGSLVYTFTTPFVPDISGFHYHFKAWATHSLDQLHNNDTAYKAVSLLKNTVIAALPVNETFEGLPDATYHNTMGIDGYDAIDFMSSTDRGRLRTFVNTGFARTGTGAVTLDQAPYSETLNADSLYFAYNLISYNNKQLRYDFFYKNQGQDAGNSNKVFIRGSEFDNWVEAFDLYDNQGEPGEWKQGKININEVLGNAQPQQQVTNTFQIKYLTEGYTSANSANPETNVDDGYTIDDIQLQEVDNDLAVTQIVSPDKSSCSMSAANPVAIKIKSYTGNVQTNVQANYQINDGDIISENIPVVSANQSLDFTFGQTADLSLYIDYKIKVWISDGDDLYHPNDTLVYFIHGSPVINSYPYLQRFESSDGNFYGKGKNSTWQWGTPAKIFISKAANGSKCWTTNLAGKYRNNENSYLYSPCFDLTGLNKPMLSFAHIFEIEQDYDYTWAEYSTDGTNWQKLGVTDSGTNWYDNRVLQNWTLSKTIWHVASAEIPVTGTVVRFRFVLSSDAGVTKEGIGIDDIHIFDRQPVYSDTTNISVSADVNGTGWVHFVDKGKRIASVNSNGQNLGNTLVSVFPKYSFVKNNNGRYYLGRNYVVRPSAHPVAGVALRLYFTNDEINNLLDAPGCDTCALPDDAFELGITGYSGITENGSLQDNISGNYHIIQPDSVDIIPYDNGYYAEFTTDTTGEFWLSRSDVKPAVTANCGGSIIIICTSQSGEATYQWQENSGSGFVNIFNGIDYSGTATDTLKILNKPTSASGTQYRCLVNGVADNERVLRFVNIWNGSADTNWFNSANWSCGQIPDQFTDVIILQGITNYPFIPADASVKSIRLQSGSSVNVSGNAQLQIKGN